LVRRRPNVSTGEKERVLPLRIEIYSFLTGEGVPSKHRKTGGLGGDGSGE